MKISGKLPNAFAEAEMNVFAVLTQFPHENLLKALDHFVVGETPDLKLHLVYELHATSLWDAFLARSAGNTPESQQAYRGQVQDLAAALIHLHSIGICHGNVTLKNCLLAHSGTLRLADYSTAHSSHGFLVRPTSELTTLYTRAPETFLGATASTTATDMWALGVVSFVLASGDCSWLDFESVPKILRQLQKLLGPITADSWPNHDGLPLWREMKNRLHRPQGVAGTLQTLAEEGRRAQEGQRLVLVIEVAHRCMKWCPEHRPSSRSLLASMQSVPLESPPQEATSSAARPLAAAPETAAARPLTAAPETPARDVHSDEADGGHCGCSGSCGNPVCKAASNQRDRYGREERLCERSCLPGFNLCTLCQCEAMENDIQCRGHRLARNGKRFCHVHAAQFKISEQQRATHYANRYGLHKYGSKWGHELKFAAKCAHILAPWTQPADVDSLVNLLQEVCAPALGKELSAADLHD